MNNLTSIKMRLGNKWPDIPFMEQKKNVVVKQKWSHFTYSDIKGRRDLSSGVHASHSRMPAGRAHWREGHVKVHVCARTCVQANTWNGAKRASSYILTVVVRTESTHCARDRRVPAAWGHLFSLRGWPPLFLLVFVPADSGCEKTLELHLHSNNHEVLPTDRWK